MRGCVYANVVRRSPRAFGILSSVFFAKFVKFFVRATRKYNQLGPDRVASRKFFGYVGNQYLRASQAYRGAYFP